MDCENVTDVILYRYYTAFMKPSLTVLGTNWLVICHVLGVDCVGSRLRLVNVLWHATGLQVRQMKLYRLVWLSEKSWHIASIQNILLPYIGDWLMRLSVPIA